MSTTANSLVVPDEVLKRERGGPDHDRSNGAYSGVFEGQTVELQQLLSRNYLEPSDDDIDNVLQATHVGRQSEVALLVPMRENGPQITPMLGAVAQWLPRKFITIVNNGSDDRAIEAVRRHAGVNLIFAEDALDTINWERLLDILNLDNRPVGKGVAMLAGHLFQHQLAVVTQHTPKWVVQHDAEIQEYQRYRALLYLLWGALERPDAHYVKMAKFGRGNETCMAARAALPVIADVLEQIAGCVTPESQRARDLYANLLDHKWMLTGEFMLAWNLAMHRPFATGYLEETLCSIFAADVGRNANRQTIHVANPNPRLDGANDDRKECVMQQQITNFLFRMIGIVPTTDWTLTTIRELNRKVMEKPIAMGWIPPNDGSVVAEVVANDRIIPSVHMLLANGFVDLPRLEEVVARFVG